MIYRKKQDLVQLIESLSMAEKRYFSLWNKAVTTKKESANYLQLFHTITNSKSVDSDLHLNTALQTRTNAAKRLYANILKGLLMFHQDSSVDITIQSLLSEVEILYGLALPGQSHTLLLKAYKLAVAHEKFGLLLHILQWERRINIVLDKPYRPVESIAEEEQEVLEKITQITYLENIYSKARQLKKQHGYISGNRKKEVEQKTIKASTMPALHDCNSHRARYYHHFIHAVYYTMIYNHKRAYEYSKKLLTSPIQFLLPNDYIDGILDHVTSCLCLGYFEEALQALALSDAYVSEQKLDQSGSLQVLVFYYKISAHLIIFNYMGREKELMASIEEAQRQLKTYDRKLPSEMKQVILGNLRNAYIGIGNLDEASHIMDLLFRKESKLVRKEIYDDLFLFRLFTLLQSRTFVLLPSMALSAYRYFKQHRNTGMHFNAEIRIANLLMKELDYEQEKVFKTCLLEIRSILLGQLSRLKGVNDFQEYYSFYIIWIDSLHDNRPFHEQAQIWYGQRLHSAEKQ